MSFAILSDTRRAYVISFCALLASGCAVVWFRSLHNELAGALYGWSPTTLMASFWTDPAFALRDYPGGEEELLKSAAYFPLPFMGALGLPKWVVFPLLIALEVAALAAGAIFATRRLVSGATISVAAVAALLLVAGSLASANLARWGQPYYGSVYNYAYGAGLAGVAYLLTDGVKRGSLLIAATYIIHPILGLFFGLFAAAGILTDLARYRWRELFGGALIFGLIVGAWTLYTMRGAQLSAAAIPADAFVAFSKMMGYHWFPVSMGVFGQIAYERFVPFLSLSTLIALYLFHDRWLLTRVERQVVAGLATLSVVTVLGILMAEYSNTPFLIKLALHRASAVLLMFGALYVAQGLLGDLVGGSWWRAVPAAALMASVFVNPYGPPVALSLLLAVIAIVRDFPRRPHAVLMAAILAVLIAMTWLFAEGYLQATPDLYSSISTFSAPLFLGLFSALLALRVIRLGALTPIVLAVGAAFWAMTLMPIADASTRDKATAYLDIQRWAKANTPPGTLFMVDPGHAYGWREYSERPSFGSVREWLYAGWIYNSRRDVYDAGLERVAFVGLTIEEILRREAANPGYGRARLPIDVQKLYYSASGDWFEAAARRFRIDYFVLDETMAAEVPGLETVYRNAGYSIRRVASNEPR